jgi:hypothetical protein
MSALKSNVQQLYNEKVKRLDVPWCDLLNVKEEISINDILKQLEHQELQVSGIMVGSDQFNFEKIAQQTLCARDKSQLLLALHGLAISCVTGTVHPYLESCAQNEWYSTFRKMKIKSNYIFMHICKHSFNELASHFIGKSQTFEWLNTCMAKNGDTALHMAIRNRQWEWGKWLLEKGLSPFLKNNAGETAVSLTAPHNERLQMFSQRDSIEWFNTLHDALVMHREDTSWCFALIEMGADVNQIELYDSPLESLLVFAKSGMDMNLGPLPDMLTEEQLRLFFMYGRQPTSWKHVIRAFPDKKIQLFINVFHNKIRVDDVEYIENVCSRRAISQKSKDLIQMLISD